ncbi:hypothetical protein F4054_09110 [Candidatus Poribacteria bacterium]|nr:hypothetical protein [Candidatus Poribacteria bacterium]MYG08418.1 hypothetical protein [Candidatus Poribacteria bacterium]MYK22407.1 hypothetical protein [Candidatus Poribacteria bacterium]
MLHQFFQKHQTLLILIGAGLLALGGWLWISTPRLTPKAPDNIVSQTPIGEQDSKIGSLPKSLKNTARPQQRSRSNLPRQPVPFTRPLSDKEARKIEAMTVRLMESGPFTEEQYRIERARVLTEDMDSLSAVKLLERLGEHHKSIAEYAKRAYADNPNNPEALLYWSTTLESKDEKNAVYHRVLEIDPNSATALLRLGRNLAYDDPHTAIEHLTKVEEMQHPLAPTPYHRFARAYERIGEYDKAIEAYRKGYENDPHSDRAPYMRAQIEDLEAGIYKVPLWQPEEAETDNLENQVPDMPDNFIPEIPTPTETDSTHTPEDTFITNDTETMAREAKIDREIQEFLKNMSDTQLAEFQKFIANEYLEFSEGHCLTIPSL